jgi:DNA-directed RNA polymerase specialized sigma24 family protein
MNTVGSGGPHFQDLVKRACESDDQALRELYEYAFGCTRAFLESKFSEPRRFDVNEVAHDACVRTLLRLPALRLSYGDASLIGYVCVTARRLAIRRREAGERQRMKLRKLSEDYPSEIALNSPAASPATRHLEPECQKCVENASSEWSPRVVAAITRLLLPEEDFASVCREIAAEFECHRTTVHKSLREYAKKLWDKCQKCCGW